MLTGRGVVDTRFNISKGLSGSQIVRPAGDEKPGIKFVWPKVKHILLWCYLPTEKKRKHNMEFHEEKQNKCARCLTSNSNKID